ncbi:MAG TPA: histidine kinase [Pyrinomonadaceae bacterium]|jgi:sensor histidine kinase YesM
MKKAVVIFIHSGYWLIYLLLLSVIFTIANLQIRKTATLANFLSLFPLIIFCVVPNLISFYSFYLFLFPRFLFRKKFLSLIIFGALFCLLSGFSGGLLSLAFFGFGQAIFQDAREFFVLTASLFLIASIHGAVALVIRGFISWYTEIKLKEELAQKSFEMELALIKSQINPHFLFNTINNIDVLIAKNPKLASVYLNKLSVILRYMVYETRNEKISLAAELDYIEKYLELQKIRTTNPDYVNFQITGEPNNLQIAPMILFPFIENAFKHTENKKNSNSILLRISLEKDKLVFECENSHQTNRHEKQDFGGLGNALVKKRLKLTYPEKHALEITDGEGIYKVKLTLYEN